jgi:HAD superfamily 5'-nucleotidase-like hydrolase
VATLFGTLAVSLRAAGAHSVDHRAILTDIREMLDRAHVRGRLKQNVVTNLNLVVARKPHLVELLEYLRAAGKKIFLLTNSDFDYTIDLMSHILPHPDGSDFWRTLFELVVVGADKPEFFLRQEDPSLIVAAGKPASTVRGGCGAFVESSLEIAGDQIMFIGDNPVADGAAARALGWRTGLVVPELGVVKSTANPLDAANHRNHWGDPLWEKGNSTRFGRVVGESADVSAPCVEDLLSVAPDAVLESR